MCRFEDMLYVAAVTSSVDVPGHQKLPWEEFAKRIKRQLRCMRGIHLSMREMRRVFDAVSKSDRHGPKVQMDDVFAWALDIASTMDSGGIEKAFHVYDRSGEGAIDPLEFFALAEDNGFGEMANDLIVELDKDGSGSISFAELMLSIRRQAPGSTVARRFLLTLAFDGPVAEGRSLRELHLGAWPEGSLVDEGTSATEAPEELRLRLVDRLADQGASLAAFYSYLKGGKAQRAFALGKRGIVWELDKKACITHMSLRTPHSTNQAHICPRLGRCSYLPLVAPTPHLARPSSSGCSASASPPNTAPSSMISSRREISDPPLILLELA